MNLKLGSSIFLALLALVLAVLLVIMIIKSKKDYDDGKRDDAKKKITYGYLCLSGVILLSIISGVLYVMGGKQQIRGD